MLSQKIILDMCLNLLREHFDGDLYCELSKNDEWGLQLLRKLVTFFDKDLLKQLELLREITTQLLWWLSDKQSLTDNQIAKMNLKLIHFLQFLEEIYC